jgi:pyruvate ferredoxin oxidoreductase beta subunit
VLSQIEGSRAVAEAVAHCRPWVVPAYPIPPQTHIVEALAKVVKAMSPRGARYLHVLIPCPLGWGTASCDTIRIARLAVQCGLFPVYEAEHGDVVSASPVRRRVPVEEYLRLRPVCGRVPVRRHRHAPRGDLIGSVGRGARR